MYLCSIVNNYETFVSSLFTERLELHYKCQLVADKLCWMHKSLVVHCIGSSCCQLNSQTLVVYSLNVFYWYQTVRNYVSPDKITTVQCWCSCRDCDTFRDIVINDRFLCLPAVCVWSVISLCADLCRSADETDTEGLCTTGDSATRHWGKLMTVVYFQKNVGN